MIVRSTLLVCVCVLALASCGTVPASAPPVPDAAAAAATEAPATAVPTLAAALPTSPPPTLPPSPSPAPTEPAPTEPAPTDPPAAATASPVAQATLAATDTALLGESQRAPTAAPTPPDTVAAPSEPVRMVIETINLDRSLVSVGLDQSRVPIVPKHDVGWYNLSAKPEQGENVVMWGHVLRFKNAPKIPAPFAQLKEVPVGARITIYTADGQPHNYIVQEQVWVNPDQVEYILPLGSERLTLVSCIGDKVVDGNSLEMTHRLVTIAAPEA